MKTISQYTGELFIRRSACSRNARKQQLIRDRGHKCESCGGATWLGKLIPLDLHRINKGKPYRECTPEELRLLCPNCHALEGRGREWGHQWARATELNETK